MFGKCTLSQEGLKARTPHCSAESPVKAGQYSGLFLLGAAETPMDWISPLVSTWPMCHRKIENEISLHFCCWSEQGKAKQYVIFLVLSLRIHTLIALLGISAACKHGG